jgi:hypothetical protein
MAADEPTASDLPLRVVAELYNLRDRVQAQHALLDVYRRLNEFAPDAKPVRTIDVSERFPQRVNSIGNGGTTVIEGHQSNGAIDRPRRTTAPPGAPWWPSQDHSMSPLVPNAGWSVYALTPQLKTAIGFSVCGATAASAQAVVELVLSVQKQMRNFIPLFMTDLPDLSVFRRFGFAVEYLAAVRPSGISEEFWKEYSADKRRFLIRKWNLARIVDLGTVLFGGEPIQPELLSLSEHDAAVVGGFADRAIQMPIANNGLVAEATPGTSVGPAL